MALEKEKLYTEDEYYQIEYDGKVEFDNGKVYFQARPNSKHQDIMLAITSEIRQFLKGKHCRVFTELEVRLQCENDIKIVIPDISVICDKDKINEKGCNGSPDFIIEIVSKGNRMHDYVKKLSWYADAGVKEYWIIDYYKKIVTVYLFDSDYMEVYSFADKIPINIWNGDLEIDLKELELL